MESVVVAEMLLIISGTSPCRSIVPPAPQSNATAAGAARGALGLSRRAPPAGSRPSQRRQPGAAPARGRESRRPTPVDELAQQLEAARQAQELAAVGVRPPLAALRGAEVRGLGHVDKDEAVLGVGRGRHRLEDVAGVLFAVLFHVFAEDRVGRAALEPFVERGGGALAVPRRGKGLARGVTEVTLELLPRAEQQRAAVVGAGDHEPGDSSAQADGGVAAQAVAEEDRVVARAVGRVDLVLDQCAQALAVPVSVELVEVEVKDVRAARHEVTELTQQGVAGKQPQLEGAHGRHAKPRRGPGSRGVQALPACTGAGRRP